MQRLSLAQDLQNRSRHMETTMPTTQNILDQHLKSFSENDLKGVLADYSTDAVFFIPGTALKGTDSIKPFFENLLSEFAKPGASFSMQHQCVEGEYAYILWSAETADNSYEAATDTFVVREGKIVAQSFAARIIPKH
jgi:ketosteroid isomerase-like protein